VESKKAVPDKSVCLEWGNFSESEMVRATSALTHVKLGYKSKVRSVENITGYWVYIPPLKSRTAITQKISHLKEQGIRDYFIVTEAGHWKNAISLGVFRTQNAAQHFLDNIQRKKNVTEARIGKSFKKIKLEKFILTGMNQDNKADLNKIRQDFAESELKEVSCALTR
jgi:choline kinase